MVNGITSYSNYMNYMQPQAARGLPDPAEMFNKVDTDGSGGISQPELDTFAQELSNKTGKSIDSTGTISTYDTDENGELSQDELKSFMDANGMAPPPPPGGPGMMHGKASGNEFSDTDADSIISAYDTNGDGVLSSDELQAYLDNGSSSFFASLIRQALTAYGAISASSSIFNTGDTLFNFDDLNDYSPVDLSV